MAIDTKFVRGADRLSQRVKTIRNAIVLPAMVEEITDLLLKRTQKRFDRQVDPNENRWPALKESTISTKKRLGFGDKPPLVRTRAMRDAIHAIRGGLGTTYFRTGVGSRIGIEDPEIAEYAKVQNKGLKSHNIPARRFLGIGALDIKAVDSLLRRKARQLEKLWQFP